MTSDETSGHRDREAPRGGAPGADQLRDFLLGVAAQIDQLAGVLGGSTEPAAAGAGASGADLGLGLTGELTSLITEIGDLLARLIAALIAVLEAIAKALRSTPPAGSEVVPGYQPIDVRIDLSADTEDEF